MLNNQMVIDYFFTNQLNLGLPPKNDYRVLILAHFPAIPCYRVLMPKIPLVFADDFPMLMPIF